MCSTASVFGCATLDGFKHYSTIVCIKSEKIYP